MRNAPWRWHHPVRNLMADDAFETPILDSEDEEPDDCVPSALVVTVYTRRRRYVGPRASTQDVAGVIRAALDRDFPDLAAIRLSPAFDPRNVDG